MKYLKKLESHFNEQEILEDLLVEYIDKYHLVEYETIVAASDFMRFWEDDYYTGCYSISNKYQSNDKFTITVKRTKVNVGEFYSDMDKLKYRLEKMGFKSLEKWYNSVHSPTFGYSLLLITKSTPLR